MGPEGGIQVSTDYTANVTNIVNNDSNVQNLISQRLQHHIHPPPIITTTIDGNAP